MSKPSSSMEDYLEAIVMLGGSPTTPVRSVDVANKLDVSKVSVNKAVAVLKENGLADKPYYSDITLTDAGYERGSAVLERHRLLYDFLTKAVKIPPEIAEDEACKMEHAISDESFDLWKVYVATIGIE